MRWDVSGSSKYVIVALAVAILSVAFVGGLFSSARIGSQDGIPAIWRYYETSGELDEEEVGNTTVMSAYSRIKRKVMRADGENKYEVSRIYLDVERDFEMNLDDTIVDNMELSVEGVPYNPDTTVGFDEEGDAIYKDYEQRFDDITVEVYVANYGDELKRSDWDSFNESQKVAEWKYPSDASESVSRTTDLEQYVEDGDLQLVLKTKNDMNTFYSGKFTGLEVENMVLEWEGKDEETFESKEDVSEIQFSKSGISVDMSWKWWLIMIFVIFAIGLIMGGMGGMK